MIQSSQNPESFLPSEIFESFVRHLSNSVDVDFEVPSLNDLSKYLDADQISWSRNEIGEIDGVAIFQSVDSSCVDEDFSGRKIQIQSGDLKITSISGTRLGMSKVLGRLMMIDPARSIWVEIFQECSDAVGVIRSSRAKFVYSKIDKSTAIKGVYLIGDNPMNRISSVLMHSDVESCVEMESSFVDETEIKSLIREIQCQSIFHSGMSKVLMMKNTDRPGSSILRSIIQRVPAVVNRIFLTHFAPTQRSIDGFNAAKFETHGSKDGETVRLHVPIETSEESLFSIWSLDGSERSLHLSRGCLWYLDSRKPQAFSNPTSAKTVHLVIDAVSNQTIREMIVRPKSILETHRLNRNAWIR